jgi:hypothetical protein
MVDIPRIAAIQPTPPAAVSAPPPVTAVPATTTNVPDKIQNLAQQIQVNATVTQVNNGTVTVNTALGTLTLSIQQTASQTQQQVTEQLLAALQSQKPITVVIQPGSPPTQAVVLLPQTGTANSAATNTAAQTSAAANAAALADLAEAASQFRQNIIPGITLPAVVLPPAGQPAAPTPLAAPVIATPTLQAAAVQTQTAQAVTPSFIPQGGINPDIVPDVSAAAIQNELSTQGKAGAVPQPLSAPNEAALAGQLQPGDEVALHVDGVVPPAQNTASSATPVAGNASAGIAASANAPLELPISTSMPAPGPNQILATVVGNGPGGQPILQAGDATLYVKQSVNAPVGTTLLLTVGPLKTPPITIGAPAAPNFPGLQQALNAISQIDPQLARAIIDNHILQPNGALPGALLFFMSAMKQGNTRGWLGDDAINALTRTGKFDLLNKLGMELQGTGSSASDAVVGEWRSYAVPLYMQGQFQALNFYVHSDGGGNTGNADPARKNNGHTRFLIDTTMSKLGALQLDGFVQPKKLDMIIRSEHVLPDGLHTDLRKAYSSALTAIDYAGSLNFQVGRQHWIVIQRGRASAAITT